MSISESVSIPIAPSTGCCSDSPEPQAGSLPIVSGQHAGEGCCTEKPLVGVGAPTMAATPGDEGSSESQPAGEATPEDAVPLDDAALIDALRQVIDPELMINIVDLGLVYSINHTDRKVLVEMTLTSPACPAGPQIISQAKMFLEKLSGVDVAEIKLTMSPPWTPDRMTDDARDQLGIF